MIAIQILIVLAAIGFAIWMIFTNGLKKVYGEDRFKNKVVTGMEVNPLSFIIAAITLICASLFTTSFGEIPAGHRGIVLKFGAITGKELGEGLYMVTPGVESVQVMDLQVHASTFESTAASKDLQDVTTSITVNYRLDRGRVSEVYRDLRNDYVERVMVPANQEAVKAATAQFDAERLVVERTKVKDMIESLLARRLEKHGILVDGVSITEFKFSPEFSKAIEAKVTATQQALKAENDLKRVKAEAQQQIESAKAQAEAIRIQANAINSQGGRDYVALKWIEAWEKGGAKVPQWWMGGQGSGVIPMINIEGPK